jgi:uncharacterized protein YggE
MYVSQSIQRPHGVTAFGSSLLRVEPDYASIRIGVSRVAATPAPAFEAADAAARAVRQFLLADGISDAEIQISQVGLEQAYEGYGEQRRAIGYRAHTSFQITLARLERFQPLMVGLVAVGADQIHGVGFKTRRLRELRDQARQAAVQAARRKAEVYAEAAGARVGGVLHIEDVNADEVGRRSHLPDIDLANHDEAGTEGSGSIVIPAAVMVSFALLA